MHLRVPLAEEIHVDRGHPKSKLRPRAVAVEEEAAVHRQRIALCGLAVDDLKAHIGRLSRGRQQEIAISNLN